jgi:hypothetical protein
MIAETPLMAVRSTPGLTEPPDDAFEHYFDVSCSRCQRSYGVWGLGTLADDELNESKGWLTGYLPTVCPHHRDAFTVDYRNPECAN